MMKNLIICCLLLIFSSCTEEWDKHYEEKRGPLVVMDQTVYEYLQGLPEYSEFVKTLKQSKADSILQIGQRYTIWAPKNEYFPSEEIALLNDSIQRLRMYNHITPIEYPESSFEEKLVLRTFTGKSLWMHKTQDGYTINENKINKTLVVCKDGIIYDMDGFLDMKPTLYQGFWGGGKYNVMQDVLNRYMDSVFVEDLSTEIGIDFEGRPIYDSIFEQRISVFNFARIDEDYSHYSVFLTPDSELKSEIELYFKNVEIVTGFTPDEDDSTKLYDWLAYSFIHNGLIEDDEYETEDNRSSFFGRLWKTSYQDADISSKQVFSNGYLYAMKDLFIPYSLIETKEMSNALATVYNFDSTQITITIKDEFKDLVTLTQGLAKPEGSSSQYLLAKLALKQPTEDDSELDFSISWTTAIVEIDTATDELAYKEVAITPGEYEVEITFVKSADANQDFAIYINDKYVNKVDMSEVTDVNKAVTVNLGRVEIEQKVGVAPVKVTMKNLSKSWKQGLAPMSISLERTINNY